MTTPFTIRSIAPIIVALALAGCGSGSDAPTTPTGNAANPPPPAVVNKVETATELPKELQGEIDYAGDWSRKVDYGFNQHLFERHILGPHAYTEERMNLRGDVTASTSYEITSVGKTADGFQFFETKPIGAGFRFELHPYDGINGSTGKPAEPPFYQVWAWRMRDGQRLKPEPLKVDTAISALADADAGRGMQRRAALQDVERGLAAPRDKRRRE